MKKAILILSLVAGFTRSTAQTFNPLLAAMLQDTLNYYVSVIPNIKGMSASVYLPGQGMWQGVAGVSHAGSPITSDMKFGIASNTKLFVSAVVLKLAENNLLDLDDSLHKWLPAYPNINSNITLRQLLNHTSGISDPLFVPPYMDTIKNNSNRVFTPAEVLGWVASPYFPAGTSWGYSNVNYILAGLFAEAATGFTISRLIRDSILTPLNLDSTFYDVEEPSSGVIAHRWWNGVDYHDTSRVGLNSAGGCAGSLFSTSGEMARWYNALFGGQIISSTSMNELTGFVSTTNPVMNYGLGLSRETTLGKTYWGHGGSTWGYRSKMIYDTCMNAVVCGLSNSFPSGMEGVTFLLYQVLLNHLPACAGSINGPGVVCQGQDSVFYSVPVISNATSYQWILPAGASGSSNSNGIYVNFSDTAVSGNMAVNGVNSYGGGGQSQWQVTVNQKPSPAFISQNLNSLHSSASSGNQWFNSGAIINGATGPDYNVMVTGKYYVMVTLSGCTSDTSNNIVMQLTNIGQTDNDSPINVFPNPAADELTIEPSEGHRKIQIEILNSSGQLVHRRVVKSRTTIHLQSFAPGNYFIKCENGKTIRFHKTGHATR